MKSFTAFATLLAAALATGEAASASDPVRWPEPLIGTTSTDHDGWDFNRCVPNVPAAFQALSTQGDWAAYLRPSGFEEVYCDEWSWLDDDLEECNPHFQGIQRRGQYLYLSRSGRHEVEVAHLGSRANNGRRWRSNLLQRGRRVSATWPDPARDRAVRQIRAARGDHGGGTQAIGNVLLVPQSKDRRTHVEAFRLRSSPQSAYQLAHPTRLNNPFVVQSSDGTAVGAVKLQDGRHLLAVVSKNDRYQRMKLFVSDGPDLVPPPHDRLRGFIPLRHGDINWQAPTQRRPTRLFQNIALISECGSGRVFIIGLVGRRWGGGGNKAVLFRLDAVDNSPRITEVASKEFDCHTNNDQRFCDFDHAAGIYVLPDGALTLYAAWGDDASGDGRRWQRFVEFPPRNRNRGCRRPEDSFATLLDASGPPEKVTDFVVLDLIDQGRNDRDLDRNEDMDDRVSSASYCVQKDYRLRLHDGTAHHDLTGDGRFHHRTLRGFGNRADAVTWLHQPRAESWYLCEFHRVDGQGNHQGRAGEYWQPDPQGPTSNGRTWYRLHHVGQGGECFYKSLSLRVVSDSAAGTVYLAQMHPLGAYAAPPEASGRLYLQDGDNTMLFRDWTTDFDQECAPRDINQQPFAGSCLPGDTRWYPDDAGYTCNWRFISGPRAGLRGTEKRWVRTWGSATRKAGTSRVRYPEGTTVDEAITLTKLPWHTRDQWRAQVSRPEASVTCDLFNVLSAEAYEFRRCSNGAELDCRKD